MAYDIFVFDAAAAPRDRHAFLDWIARAFREHEGSLGGDAARATPELQAWQAEMRRVFPSAGDPHAFDGPAAARRAFYRFTPGVIQASFEWQDSGPALMRARKAAQVNGVGLFDASGRDGAVWMRSRGRWEVVHRNDERVFG